MRKRVLLIFLLLITINVSFLSLSFPTKSADFDYQWISQSNYPILAPGEEAILWVKIKNTGTAVWKREFFRLGTSHPRDRSSRFFSGKANWISINRIKMDELEVAPGEIASFGFWIKVPQEISPGVYREYFSPVADGITWLKDIGIYWDIIVTEKAPVPPSAPTTPSAYDFQFISQSAYPTLAPSGIATLTLTLKNTGTATWKNYGPNPLRLGTSHENDRASDFYHESWISPNRACTLDQPEVPPGSVGTFTFKIQVPSNYSPGVYREYFQPVVDGITWMKDIGIYWEIEVISLPPIEGELSFTVFPDKWIKVDFDGSIKDFTFRTMPYQKMSVEYSSFPLASNKTQIRSITKWTLNTKELQIDLSKINLNAEFHKKESSITGFIDLDFPDYIGIKGDLLIKELEENNKEATFNLNLKLYYNLFSKEKIEEFIESFPLFKEDIISKTEASGEIETLEINLESYQFKSEWGELTISLYLKGSLNLFSLLRSFYPLTPGLEEEIETPTIKFPESFNLYLSFDKETNEFELELDEVVENLNEDFNFSKNLLLQQLQEFSVDDLFLTSILRTFQEMEFDISGVNLSYQINVVPAIEEVLKEVEINYNLRNLKIKPGDIGEFLQLVQISSERFPLPDVLLTLRSGEKNGEQTKIILLPEVKEPQSQTSTEFSWPFVNLENFYLILFEE